MPSIIQQAGTGDGAGGGATSGGGHELVGRAVDDEGGGGDAVQFGGAVARSEDGGELAGDRAGVVAAVIHRGRATSAGRRRRARSPASR